MRINHAHAIQGHEPDLPIRGFRDGWIVRAVGKFVHPYSVRAVENGGVDHLLRSLIPVRCGSPGVHLGVREAHQPTWGIQPERVIVVLYHPVNRIAG